MLVLHRKPGQRIIIGDDVIIEVLSIEAHDNSPKLSVVRIGVDAPVATSIDREEIKDARLVPRQDT